MEICTAHHCFFSLSFNDLCVCGGGDLQVFHLECRMENLSPRSTFTGVIIFSWEILLIAQREVLLSSHL